MPGPGNLHLASARDHLPRYLPLLQSLTVNRDPKRLKTPSKMHQTHSGFDSVGMALRARVPTQHIVNSRATLSRPSTSELIAKKKNLQHFLAKRLAPPGAPSAYDKIDATQILK